MIAVAGGKGGAGKTTTALGLARIMGERQPVTVVDGNVDMPDLHVLTETPAAPGISSVEAGTPLAECCHPVVDEPGLSVVPADGDPESISTVLERFRSVEGEVIVDTAAGASIDVTRPLRVADAVILVSTPTKQSIVDTAKTAALARKLDVPVLGAVLNRSEGDVDPVDVLGCPVLAHVPTVCHPHPHRAASRHYRRAVRAIRKRNA